MCRYALSLVLREVDGIGTVITVTSGKGGTGKTSTAAALASILATLGHRTLALDADAGLRNLDITLGLADAAVMDFSDVLSGHASLEDAVYPHPQLPGLFLLNAPVWTAPEDIPEQDMRRLFDEIKAEFDFCVVDGPAGIGAGFRLAVSGADRVIVVSNTVPTSIRDAERVNMELMRLGLGSAQLVVNRVRPRLMRRARTTIDDAIDGSGLQLLGLVPEDEAVLLAGETGVPLILRSDGDAAHAFLNIAKRITGERVPLMRRLRR